jgi:hypothetical protein
MVWVSFLRRVSVCNSNYIIGKTPQIFNTPSLPQSCAFRSGRHGIPIAILNPILALAVLWLL